jgi:hypothetical protein
MPLSRANCEASPISKVPKMRSNNLDRFAGRHLTRNARHG